MQRLITKDETLPSGSIIHWSEADGKSVPVTCGRCKRKRLDYSPSGKAKQGWRGFCWGCAHKKKLQDVILPSGSTIHYSEPDPEIRRHARHYVTCGKCGEKRLVNLPSTKILRGEYTGLCPTCARRKRLQPIKRTADELHHTGAIIHWGEREPGKPRIIPFTCASCSEKTSAWQATVNGKKWRGLCKDCRSKQERPSTRKRTDVVIHLSGTVCNWAEREPGKPYNIGITCYLCLQNSFLNGAWTKSREWDGRCHNCVQKYGKNMPNKRTDDQKLPSGSKILWTQTANKQVPVVCALCPNSDIWIASRESIKTLFSQYKRRGQSWPGYCKKHRNIASLSAALMSKATQHSKSQTRSNAFDGPDFLSKTKRAIILLYGEGISRNKISSGAIATKVGLRGTHGAEQLRQNLRKASEQRSVPELVDSVIDEWLFQENKQETMTMPA